MTVIIMTILVSYHVENNHGYELRIHGYFLGVQGILTQVFSL